MKLNEATIHPDVKRLITRFPTAVRSSRWADMEKLARSGELDQAIALAKKMESRREILQQNVVARRLRIERVALFARIRLFDKDLSRTFGMIGDDISKAVERWGTQLSNLKKLNTRVREEIVILRREIRKQLRSLMNDGALLALKNSQSALQPLFVRAKKLREDRMVFSMDGDVAARNTADINIDSAKWTRTLDKILTDQQKELVGGLTLSQRVYDLTTRAQNEINRLIGVGIAAGDDPLLIARRIKKYLSPTKYVDATGREFISPGAYYSPYKNARRVARTEVIRTYTQTTAAYAEDKWWIKGMMITLSPQHSDPDICDDYAGKVVSAEEFGNLVPFHPHCMCYPTYVFDPSIFPPEEED